MKIAPILLLCALALPCAVRAQNAAEAGPWVRATYLDDNGAPCNSCILWSFVAGSTTPQTTYTTTAGNVANTNPVVLDAAGRADVFLGPHAYKLVLEHPPAVDDLHGSVIWTEDNLSPLGLIAYQALGSAVNACSVTYLPPYTGAVAMNLCTFLSSQIDVRTFGAVGVQGNCHGSTIDNQPAIQAALNYAGVSGPLDVLLPNGYCWPIATHLWIPPTVRFHGIGRTVNYEISSPGSLLIANANWATANPTFPYTQMVWTTGDNFTSGPYLASNVTFATEVDHMELNCNDQPGCGWILAVGRQEKSTIHDLVMTGAVGPASGYGYGFYEQSVDCNGAVPPAGGCLLAKNPTPATDNPWSGEQGPDHHLEFFHSFSVPSSNFIPYAEMGMNDYKGLEDTTVNCVGNTPPQAMYVWGSNGHWGKGLHIEGCGAGNNVYIGNVPAGSSCLGADNSVFYGQSSAHYIIANCSAQTALSFIGVVGGITNNSTAAPSSTVTDIDYYFDASTSTIGPLGIKGGVNARSEILLNDPGSYFQNGFEGYKAYQNNRGSGWNAAAINEAGSGFTRGYSCGNVFYSHASTNWQLGGDGGADYSCVLHLNGGNLGLSVAQTAATPFSTATMLGFARAVLSGASGHFLVGSGWLDTTTGLVVGEDPNPTVSLQVHGDVESIAGAYRVGAAGNTDNAGQLSFSGSTTSGTYNFIAQSGFEPICTASLDGGAINAYLSPLLNSPSSGQWNITLKANTAITGNGNYICFLKP